jgi:two-component system LytT family response regulator
MKKILILEDNPASRNALHEIIKTIDSSADIMLTDDVGKAYQFAMTGLRTDLFLVDIMIRPKVQSDISGLIFAERIRSVKRYEFVPLIFITSLEDPKLHAFRQLHCYEYIEKPYDATEVKRVIRRALEFPKPEDPNKYVYFRKDGVLYSKKVDEIVYIENIRRKVVVYSVDDELPITYKSCSDLLEDLDSVKFIQCNRRTIINREFIEFVDPARRYIRLREVDKAVDIGTTLRKTFMRKLGQYD